MWRKKRKFGDLLGVWFGVRSKYPVLSWRLSVAKVTATKHRQKANSTAANFIFYFFFWGLEVVHKR